ncbi:hypothetical protein Pcinc_001703 [Petrolisthes cinctipes]|uniref:Uncharacterized protein n=1 Tax=Petrolisthes cinctipes TaxID=88211 RepID=A0AAE1L4A5_PETCI|nr:hypothetical protein Pcinc_001700 [Petrolisthes cinctipes]KAK3894547.1 hypothetical protein Pcinc_001703 [Petrolisthes cinctipes]
MESFDTLGLGGTSTKLSSLCSSGSVFVTVRHNLLSVLVANAELLASSPFNIELLASSPVNAELLASSPVNTELPTSSQGKTELPTSSPVDTELATFSTELSCSSVKKSKGGFLPSAIPTSH